ncbi:MAG TPA: M48 family metalloprotease [Planctomycetota bacterium]|mgnify:CR=1 FL=1|nr:M48 family metalloprotease [Planctomycetota bacterium]
MLLVLAIAAYGLYQFWQTRTVNPVTGETQYVQLTAEQEIALGVNAAPQMAAQHGGPHPDARVQNLIREVGRRLVERSNARLLPYQYEFTALADENTVNAFALPGGQIFITMALLRRLEAEDEVAGVLGHEIAHVVARHGAQRMAKEQLTQKLTVAGAIALVDISDPSSYKKGAAALALSHVINMKFGRDDELESDRLGVEFMADAGYDPRALLKVMDVLEAAGGGGRMPEFFSTHPNPNNRRAEIQKAIETLEQGGRITAPQGTGRNVSWR